MVVGYNILTYSMQLFDRPKLRQLIKK